MRAKRVEQQALLHSIQSLLHFVNPHASIERADILPAPHLIS